MLAILMISIFAFHTVEAIAVGYCISAWLDVLISMVPAKRLLEYGIGAQMKDLWKIILISLVMFVVVQLMNLMQWNSVLLLMAQIVVGVTVYLITGFLLKVEPQIALLKVVANIISDKKK